MRFVVCCSAPLSPVWLPPRFPSEAEREGQAKVVSAQADLRAASTFAEAATLLSAAHAPTSASTGYTEIAGTPHSGWGGG